MTTLTTVPRRTIMRRLLLLAATAVAMATVTTGPASADFGIASFTSDFQDASGAPLTQAGSHADVRTFLKFNTKVVGSSVVADGQVRDITVDLPAGFYGNPQVMATCTMQDVIDSDGYCQPAAQVGVLNYEVAPNTFLDFPVYNLEAPDSQTAVLAVLAVSIPIKIVVSVRSDGNYGLRAKLRNLNQSAATTTTTLTLWGVPADPIHDPKRFRPFGGLFGGGAAAGVPPRPFLSLPARCEPVVTTIHAVSWQDPGRSVSASDTSPALTGCDQLKFDASIHARPRTPRAGAPSGYDVTVSVPQDTSVKGLATPQVRKAVVALPAGTTVNPASADGLGACTDAEMKLGTDVEPACPDSSKIGTVSIETPVLADPVAGDIVLGAQRPDQLLRLWFVVRGPGLLLKLPGKVDPDPVTGQLVVTFDGTPQLPFTSLRTSLDGGPQAALTNPRSCGTYTTHATLTPWSGGAPVEATDSFAITENCDQGRRFEPALRAGVVDPQAGGSSPFVFNLSRPDGQQDLAALEATLPAGLVGHVGEVPLCPEAQAAAGTCSATSQVGSVRALSGAGSSPLSVPQPGKAPTAVYLAGPYMGAPFSLSIVVPAQAGPFDLGTVVVRSALFIDPETARVTVKSDPLPTILQGIPLALQRISVMIDRPGFMVNPTRCEADRIVGQAVSSQGATAAIGTAFQARECDVLGYRPKLSIELVGKGQTTDDKHPALRARLLPRTGDANVRQAKVTLPLSLALDPDNANGLCEPRDAAEDRCPAKSVVGKAKAVSLLHEPLASPVYFVRGERRDPRSGRLIKTLPTLFIPLRGEGVKVNVRASSAVPDDKHLVTTFSNLPDVPLASFDLDINGGDHGILVVSGTNICSANQVAIANFVAQSGKKVESDVVMRTPCPLSVSGAGHGASTVRLKVGGVGSGKVRVSGRGLRTTSQVVADATVVAVRPGLTSAVAQTLRRGRDVVLRVAVDFWPKGSRKAQRIVRRVTVHA